MSPSALQDADGSGEGAGNRTEAQPLSKASFSSDSSTQKREMYRNNGTQRSGRAYHTSLAGSILIYWSFVSIIPVYNKHFFHKSLYPYPVATAGLQLGFVSILLAVLNTLQHLVSSHQTNCSSSVPSDTSIATRSWIFGPHFFWKAKWCFPIGALFGIKYGITNLGLHLVPAPTHLLLQSTDLVWTVLGAYIINAEVVSMVEICCLAGCVAGSVILGWSVGNSPISSPMFAILINLTSPILLGLCLATLRLACTELMRSDNRVGGTVSPVELTSIKLMLSSSVALVLACLMEGGDDTKASWWVAFSELEESTQVGVMGGAVLIAVFQVNCTFLVFLSSTVAVGLVGQVKIIPQWIVATITANQTTGFQVQKINIVGAVCIMASAAAFAIYNYTKTPFLEEGHHPYDEEPCRNGNHDLYLTASVESEVEPLLLLRRTDDEDPSYTRKTYDSVRRETT